jgi:hypothetical protein
MIFCAGGALAIHIGPIPEPPEYFLSSTSDPNARCKRSSLTQDNFLEMVHALIEHRDMTDKDFIEKTLRITFRPKYTASNHIPGGGFYKAYMPGDYKANMPGDMPDAPITVLLGIGIVSLNEASKSELSSEVLLANLDMVGAVFRNCQFLTRHQLDPKSEAIVQHTGISKEDSQVATWNLGQASKNRANLDLRYTFKTDDSAAIESIEISQHAETHLNPIGEDNAGHP